MAGQRQTAGLLFLPRLRIHYFWIGFHPDFHEADPNLKCFEDPRPATDDIPENPAHALVDYNLIETKKGRMAAARFVANIANNNGLAYQEEDLPTVPAPVRDGESLSQ